jgi:hypothetical protein
MRCVGANSQRRRAGAALVADDRPLRGASTVSRIDALRSGWSKQANIRCASSRKLIAHR